MAQEWKQESYKDERGTFMYWRGGKIYRLEDGPIVPQFTIEDSNKVYHDRRYNKLQEAKKAIVTLNEKHWFFK